MVCTPTSCWCYRRPLLDPQALFAAVEQQAGGGDPHAIVSLATGPATFDEAALLKRVDGDTALMTEIIGIFIEDCPARLAAIEAAVTTGNPEALRRAAHALKGSAGSLSVLVLFEAAEALEVIGAESRMVAADDAWRHLSAEADATLDVLRQRVLAAQ